MEFVGRAVGGPVDGKELSANLSTLIVPIKTGPDRGEGDHGFSMVKYVWTDGVWLYVG